VTAAPLGKKKILLFVLTANRPDGQFTAATFGDTFERSADQSLHGFLHATGTISLGAVTCPKTDRTNHWSAHLRPFSSPVA